MSNLRLLLARIRWYLLACIILGSGGLWLYVSGGHPHRQQNTIKPVRQTFEQVITITGQVVPRKKIKVKSQVNGLLEHIYASPGHWVKRGDLLASIQLRADPLEINNSQAQIEKSRFQNQRSAVELERLQYLHDRKIISDTAFQDAKLKFDISKTEYEQAGRDLELRIKGTSQQFKTTSTRVTAPVDGMVLEGPVALGDFVIKANDLFEGTTVFTVADMHDLIFKGSVDEADAGRLQEGMSLSIDIGALPGEKFVAILEFIAPESKKTEQGRNLIEIHAAIRLKENVVLRAGYSANARLVLQSHPKALVIPEKLLVFREHETYLKAILPTGQIVERKVTTGLSDGLNVEILEGLDDNDQLILP